MWGGAMTGLYGDGVDIFGGHGDGGVDVGLLDSKLAYIGFGVGQGIYYIQYPGILSCGESNTQMPRQRPTGATDFTPRVNAQNGPVPALEPCLLSPSPRDERSGRSVV
jgi:hypothetical protein